MSKKSQYVHEYVSSTFNVIKRLIRRLATTQKTVDQEIEIGETLMPKDVLRFSKK